jgi:hypothetical protein
VCGFFCAFSQARKLFFQIEKSFSQAGNFFQIENSSALFGMTGQNLTGCCNLLGMVQSIKQKYRIKNIKTQFAYGYMKND